MDHTEASAERFQRVALENQGKALLVLNPGLGRNLKYGAVAGGAASKAGSIEIA